MRTSGSQFQLLVDFMERHGDLSKPTEGCQGRATNIQLWAELTQLLNADATGDTKTAEKWRKVWSDFKNNTKKKAAKIYRAAQGTGGGPASNLKLGDLEQKVLAIVGPQAATGIFIIPEIGLEEEVTDQTNDGVPTTVQQPIQVASAMEDWNSPGTSTCPAAFPPLLVADRGQSEPVGITESGQPMVGASQTGLTSGGVPPPPPASIPLPQTPRRRRRGRFQDLSSPVHKRTRTQTQSDLARQAFVRSDIEWRTFQQETERERNRLRQEQLAIQEQWLELFRQLLSLGNRIVDIMEKKELRIVPK